MRLTQNFQILLRGLRGRCPQCGQGRLFLGWWQLHKSCAHCGLDIQGRESDTWAFMYISTAFITGLFILPMFWIHPTHPWLIRSLIAATALIAYILTEPGRKGIAIAFDYLVELRWNNDKGLRFRN